MASPVASPVKDQVQVGILAQAHPVDNAQIPSPQRRISLSKFVPMQREESNQEVRFQARILKEEDVSPLPITEHGLHVDNTAKELGTYRKFSEEELTALEVSVNPEGQLVIGMAGKLLDTGFEEMMYVMHKNKKIYAAFPREGVFYHSSLVPDSFDWPIEAGMLQASEGILTKINEESGHFAGAQRIELVVNVLNQNGAKINIDLVTKFMPRRLSSDKIDRACIPSPVERLRKLELILISKASMPILSSPPSASSHMRSASPRSLPSSPQSSPSLLISSSPSSSPRARSFSFPETPKNEAASQRISPEEGSKEEMRLSPSPLSPIRRLSDPSIHSMALPHISSPRPRKGRMEEQECFSFPNFSGSSSKVGTPVTKYRPSSRSISHNPLEHDDS